MKSVAVVGFAWDSLQFAKDSQADEMWTVNFAWRYEVPRIDRLFEIHPIEVLAYHAQQEKGGDKNKKHFEWLQEKHDFPIYTYADYTGANILDGIIDPPPRIPNSVPYPFEKIPSIFENLHRENRPNQIYMPSTISYMLAMAIFEGFERIEMYGVEMAAGVGGANGTEYVYQKAGTEALLMYAMGKGIEIYFPEHCKLMNIRPYHEGLQMITRQTLESQKKIYEQKRVDALTKTNHFNGQLKIVEEKREQHKKTIMHNLRQDKEKAKKGLISKKERDINRLVNVKKLGEKKLAEINKSFVKDIKKKKEMFNKSNNKKRSGFEEEVINKDWPMKKTIFKKKLQKERWLLETELSDLAKRFQGSVLEEELAFKQHQEGTLGNLEKEFVVGRDTIDKEFVVGQIALEEEFSIRKTALEEEFVEKNKHTQKEIMGIVKQASHFQGLAFMADAAVQTMDNLIKSIDYDDPLVDLVNRFTHNEVELPEKVKV